MLLLGAGLLVVEAAAQTNPAALHGSVQYELSAVQESLQPDCESSFLQASITAEMGLQSEFGGAASYISTSGGYDGSFECTGSGTIYLSQEEGSCSWNLSISAQGSGTADLVEATTLFQIGIPPDRAYAAGGGSFPATFHSILTSSCPSHNPGETTWTEPLVVGGLLGRIEGDGDSLRVIFDRVELADPGAVGTVSGTFRTGGLELVVEPQGYADWIPRADPEYPEIPGRKLTIIASLQSPDGGDVLEEAERFRFELVDVSHVPGTAMNFPSISDRDQEVDLRFVDTETALDSDSSRLWVEVLGFEENGTQRAAATLAAFDNGAFGSLKVTAFMSGGEELVGVLSSDRSITRILIPKRSDGSLIADAWKEQEGVMGLADDDDSETDPVGDGHAGDGLTLYEEYRGFREHYDYVHGNPRKKDLFIYNGLPYGSRASVVSGFMLFASVTGLEVHHRLTESEFDTAGRVINFNVGSTPHLVDQHGIWVSKFAEIGAASNFGPPKNVGFVQLDQNLPGRWTTARVGNSIIYTDDFMRHIAHELGHAVGIRHHGDGDRPREWVRSIRQVGQQTTPIILEEGDEVDVRLEDGTPYLPLLSDDLPIFVAVQGGQHSGVEDCIMRYNTALAYVPAGMPGRRYWIWNRADWGNNELSGMALCDRKEGTGIAVRRYGDAKRGACSHQICVNDRFH